MPVRPERWATWKVDLSWLLPLLCYGEEIPPFGIVSAHHMRISVCHDNAAILIYSNPADMLEAIRGRSLSFTYPQVHDGFRQQHIFFSLCL